MFALKICFVTQQLPRLKRGPASNNTVSIVISEDIGSVNSENYFVRLQVSAYQMYMSYFFGWACWSIALRFKHVWTCVLQPLKKKKENDKWVKLLWDKGQFFSLDSYKLKPIRCLATSSQRNISHHLLLYKWTLSPNPQGKTLDITWVNIHWQLALTWNSSFLWKLCWSLFGFRNVSFWPNTALICDQTKSQAVTLVNDVNY